MKGLLRLTAAALMLIGCQAAGEAPPSVSAPAWAGADAPSRTVNALAEAEAARSAGDGERLRRALMALDALGAHPEDSESADIVASWQAAAPSDMPPMRGRTLGPAYRAGEVSAGATVTLEQTFLAGQSAVLALRTQDGGEVAVRVIDGREKTMCASQGDRVRCRWTPPYTQRHEIRIRNPLGGKVRYFISFS